MSVHPNAGKPVAKEDLIDVAELISLYYETQPDVRNPDQQVAFGTSGHRGVAEDQLHGRPHHGHRTGHL